MRPIHLPSPDPPVVFEELTLSSESHAGPPMRQPTLHHTTRGPARAALPAQAHGPHSPGRRPATLGLHRFNTAPLRDAEAALLTCCDSRRWAERVAAHRPYPNLASLFAASDEAGYDLSPAELTRALAGESAATLLHDGAPQAAHTALRAAQAAYEGRFGHSFVICLDDFRPAERLDQVLAGIRSRLGHEPDEERSVSADELRRLARGRIARLVADAGRTDSPSVPV